MGHGNNVNTIIGDSVYSKKTLVCENDRVQNFELSLV